MEESKAIEMIKRIPTIIQNIENPTGDIQDYKITEFKTHYFNKSLDTWFIEEN